MRRKRINNSMNVFVGGLGGCGKKVIQKILRRAGFFLGRKSMINNDFDCPALINRYREMMRGEVDLDKHKEAMVKIMGNVEKWSLKCGMSMFCVDHTYKTFPNIKYILAYRDSVNHIAIKRNYSPEVMELLLGYDGRFFALDYDERAVFWKRGYEEGVRLLKKLPIENVHVVSFNELCRRPNETVSALLQFIGENPDPSPYVNIIERPEDYQIGYETFSKKQIKKIKKICQPTIEIISELKSITT